MQLKIAIIRALKLGDMLCFIPTLKAIREIYPSAEIHLICHSSQIHWLKRYKNLIDIFVPFPGFPGMPEQECDAVKVIQFLEDMQKQEFDIVYQLHGSGEITNTLVALFNSKESYGFYRKGHYCPDEKRFNVYPEHLTEVERSLSLVEKMTSKLFPRHADFPLFSYDFHELRDVLKTPDRPYYCIHPGASSESKRWSKEGFAAVADYLISLGFDVIFTGSRMESDLVTEIRSYMKGEALDSASLDLPMGPLAALISDSEGVICNDTGISHLAAALKKRSLVIFSETSPERWAPLNKKLHRFIIRPSLEELLLEMNLSLIGTPNEPINAELM